MPATKCPGCNVNDSWEHIGYPCLACQFTSLVYQNPFDRRYNILIDTWLPIPSDLEWSSAKSEFNDAIVTQQQTTPASITTQFKYMELKNMRRKAIDDSLDTIRSKSSIEQNRCVFEDLSALRKKFMNQEFSTHSDRGSIYSQTSLSSNNESISGDKNDMTAPSLGKKIYMEDQIKYNHGKVSDAKRPPLLALDPNTISNKKLWWPSGSKNQIRSRNRVLKKKEEKYKEDYIRDD